MSTAARGGSGGSSPGLGTGPRGDPELKRTLGITAVSAAALYLKADRPESAGRIVNRFSGPDRLPDFAADQMRDLQSELDSYRPPRIPLPSKEEIGDRIRTALAGGETDPVELAQDYGIEVVDVLRAGDRNGPYGGSAEVPDPIGSDPYAGSDAVVRGADDRGSGPGGRARDAEAPSR